MNNPGLVSLGDFTITTAVTAAVGDSSYDTVDLSGILAASVSFRLAFGSGGTTVRAWLQTSLDGGTVWTDIVCVLFGTASEHAVINLSGLTPKTTQVTPTDGALADDTAVDGILGDRFRVKYTTTGIYAGSTVLSVRLVAR